MADLNALISQATMLEMTYRERNRQKVNLLETVKTLEQEISKLQSELEVYIRACNMMGTVSDSITQETLENISGVINRALAILFPNNPRSVRVVKKMYRKVYVHFLVELITETGSVRSFKVSGSGLSQVISFLFLVCLVDARGGRKLIVMDEILNGLHPSAKGIVYDIIMALNKRFQFIIVEYGLDIGKQYVLKNTSGNVTVESLDKQVKYYKMLADHVFDDGDEDELE